MQLCHTVRMTTIQTVKYVDDLDGGEGAETLQFGFAGKAYEIDLAEANTKTLTDALAPFIAAARRAGAPARIGSTPKRRDPQESQAIREWARGQGMEISERGRISATVMQAWRERHQAA